jgi:hypothetical protein
MIVCVQNPIITSVGVIGCKCATAGTVAVTFCNPTAGALVPASGAYVFMVIKG